jgi:hypothetical protein
MTKFKTVLAPNAPWPSKETKLTLRKKPQPKFSFGAANVDYFADTYNELLEPPKKGRGNPNNPRDKATGRFKKD